MGVVQGPNSKEPIWTNLKQLESLSWTMPWTLDANPSLHLGSPNHELYFEFFFLFLLLFFLEVGGSEPIVLPSNMVPFRFSLDLLLFGLKGGGSQFMALNQ
jgi:hypothetical protein